ncbi:MAG TPA: AtpZ/AtpI family protein [Jatrophihabitans sp.]|jgi:F0F1-type ATP synthase assembly protein I|uniref:AtpZ/AtpI family protein n=1 Tax=Jatrophihabitans sp. TaxID=1932789 RepID=UPI002E00C1C8|nr:AtpZ/AtpI family protein [Jatrophihabitans sp.]
MAPESPSWQSLLGMGAVTAAVLALGMVLGWLADSIAGTTPVFIMIGLLVGVAGAVTYVVNEFRQFLKR